MEEKQILFDDVANRAVAEYNIKSYTLMFIRHSDTATFKVKSPSQGTYLLRIHVPITEAMGLRTSMAKCLESEYRFGPAEAG